MADLLLSRTLDPADYDRLGAELDGVDEYGVTPDEHPHRRWVYALALHAVLRWSQARVPPRAPAAAFDVSGPASGRRFPQMLEDWADCGTTSLTPVAAATIGVIGGGPGTLPRADVVTSFGTIERVGALEAFLLHLSRLLAPGGLLVLSMDYWNHCGADTAINRDQRLRIFCPSRYAELRATCRTLQLTPFGGVDPIFHGAHVHDYSYATLVLEKQA